MPKKHTFNIEQVQEINQAIKNTKNSKEYRRLQCLQLRAEGKLELNEISEITGYHAVYISTIICKYLKSGLNAIISVKRTSNHRKCSQEQEKELLAPFEKAAKSGQILVVADIKKAFCKALDCEMSTQTIYNILHRNGWRKIMPRSRHPKKASDEAITAYKKNQ